MYIYDTLQWLMLYIFIVVLVLPLATGKKADGECPFLHYNHIVLCIRKNQLNIQTQLGTIRTNMKYYTFSEQIKKYKLYLHYT